MNWHTHTGRVTRISLSVKWVGIGYLNSLSHMHHLAIDYIEPLVTGVSSIRTFGTKIREMFKFPFISANAKIINEPRTSSVFSVRFLVISVSECRDGRKLKITHLERHWRAYQSTAHLTQQSFWMATFSSGLKIFKIAYKDVVDNSWEVPTAPFSATNFSHISAN